MNKILIIFSLLVLYTNILFSNEIEEGMKIKKDNKCYELIQDSKYYYKKVKEAEKNKDPLLKRWIILYNKTSKNADKCLNGTINFSAVYKTNPNN